MADKIHLSISWAWARIGNLVFQIEVQPEEICSVVLCISYGAVPVIPNLGIAAFCRGQIRMPD
jgi:hypothetical protein